jgi:hypothetical protein
MFHDCKTSYFTCTFLTKFTYNEYIGPYFLSHVVLRFFASDLPEFSNYPPLPPSLVPSVFRLRPIRYQPIAKGLVHPIEALICPM